jgi:hypothetical protein
MIPNAPVATLSSIALDRRSKRRFPLRMGMWYRPTGLSLSVGWTAGECLNLSSTGLLFSSPTVVLPRQSVVLPGQRIEALIDWPARLNNRRRLRLALEGVIVRSADEKTAMRVDRYEFRPHDSSQQA